ncbi:MAG TPA: hypothetical protein VEV15_11255 [Flavisolibacter sp.]|nr:hypothetical protein [Flavisolibacter sp.]
MVSKFVSLRKFSCHKQMAAGTGRGIVLPDAEVCDPPVVGRSATGGEQDCESR